jgi:hypothetical protein
LHINRFRNFRITWKVYLIVKVDTIVGEGMLTLIASPIVFLDFLAIG